MSRNVLLFYFLGLSFHLYAQNAIVSVDTVVDRLWEQTRLFPREKLFLSTDKQTYVSGENIWFRAFVVNAISHQPELASRYAYVELINPFDSVVYRVNARQDKSQLIYGNIRLDEELPAGEYCLRAYTRYMENDNDSCFFHKQVHIMSSLEKSIVVESQLIKTSATLRFFNPETREGINLNNLTIATEKEQLFYRKDNNEVNFRLKLSTLKHKAILVKAGNYKRFISFQAANTDYHVDFLPEGGQLIQGALCKVGFKALNEQGVGENVTGEIFDNEKRVITSIKSFHHGMGYFSFIPQAGITYFAECKNDSGLGKRFQLPVVQKKGYALQISQKDTIIYVSVLGADTTSRDSLFVLVHQRGLPKYIEQWEYKQLLLPISSGRFFTGVAHFLLFNRYGSILSERIAFINNERMAQAGIIFDKKEYNSREKVSLEVNLLDNNGEPLDGNCSISVTDDRDVKLDSCVTILSDLLLSSDVRGYIEDPNWYFRNKNRKQTNAALDVLLLTQGWRRHNLENVIQGKFTRPNIFPEENMEIKGKVTTTFSRKPLEHSIVRVSAPSCGMVEELRTGVDGRFYLNGFEFPDSTVYVVTAFSEKKKDNVALDVETRVFPSINYSFPTQTTLFANNQASNPAPVEYLSKVSDRMMFEQGIRHVFLDEVIITARKKIEYKTIYQKDAQKTITEKEIKESGQPCIGMLISSKGGGVWYDGNRLTFRGGRVQLLLDGVCQIDKDKESILRYLPTSDIEQIDILKGRTQCIAYISIIDETDAIVAITTKRGISMPVPTPLNMSKFTLTGYQVPVEFYSPTYETNMDKENGKPDLRTTIYWKPDVLIERGKAKLSFYTADSQSTYSAVIEGITDKGTPYHIVRRIANR